MIAALTLTEAIFIYPLATICAICWIMALINSNR